MQLPSQSGKILSEERGGEQRTKGLLALLHLAQASSLEDAQRSVNRKNLEPQSLSELECLWRCSVQFSSAAQSCPTLFNPMNHSTPGLPVHYQLPEFTQTHAHRVSDAIQPSHPLSSPSPPSPNPSQHQGLFQ